MVLGRRRIAQTGLTGRRSVAADLRQVVRVLVRVLARHDARVQFDQEPRSSPMYGLASSPADAAVLMKHRPATDSPAVAPPDSGRAATGSGHVDARRDDAVDGIGHAGGI